MTSLLLLALAACTPKEEAGPALSVTPDAVDLGTVAIGESASATVELRNDGGGSVEILSASLVEGDSRAWSVARDGFDALDAGAVATLTVTFAPDDEGASPAALQVRSTDPANPSFYVDLAAIGGASNADADNDGVSPAEGDCDDGDASVLPGASEVCDGKDTDCNGAIPADEVDDDRDGFRVCDADCDDADGTVHPGADELCDDKDTDCDGVTPDRADADGDGWAICDEDCDDASADVFPGNPEACDGLDNDCSGVADDIDADHDGVSLCGAVPDCDDGNAGSYPVFVDPTATGGDGSPAAPYGTLAEGIAGRDTRCRTVALLPGTYTESTTWTDGEIAFVGAADDPAGVVFTPAEGERAFTITGGRVEIENVSFVGARNADGDGGAILVTDAVLVLRGVVATLNSTPADGGAVAVSSGALATEGCVFTSNTAGDDGGALATVSSIVTDDGSTFSGNRAIEGGGMLAVSTQLTLSGTTFDDNAASGDGGGLALDALSALQLDRLVFTSNTAAGRGGGAALNDVIAEYGHLRNTRFLGNTADEGGGAAFTGSYASLIVGNNTFVGNTASGEGAGMLVAATVANNLYVWTNIFAWNDGDSGLYVGDTYPSVWWNLGYATSSGVDIRMAAGFNDHETLTADPLFTRFTDDGDPYDDDLTLAPGSPAIDGGPCETYGPDGFWNWCDVDSSNNDLGYTGGVGGW